MYWILQSLTGARSIAKTSSGSPSHCEQPHLQTVG